MDRSQGRNTGRVVLAIAVSLGLHLGLFLLWYSSRDNTSSTAALSTEVEGPNDSEWTIELREARPSAIAPEIPSAEPNRLIPDLFQPPPTSQPSEAGSPTASVVPAGSGNPAASTGAPMRPLHGRFRSGESIVYLVDCSGSMGIDGLLVRACASIRDAIRQLTPDQRFAIVAYNSRVTVWGGGLRAATDQNRRDAEEFLASLHPEGGSNHAAALRAALALQPHELYLVTDACDLSTREVRAIRNLIRRPMRIHALLLGTSAAQARSALRTLCEETGGRVITPP